MDDAARGFGYDDIRSAITYLNSTNALWQKQALAFNLWRDAVWEYCLNLETQVKTGAQSVPTAQQLLTALPPANIPIV
jgi:hypothetical protein